MLECLYRGLLDDDLQRLFICPSSGNVKGCTFILIVGTTGGKI